MASVHNGAQFSSARLGLRKVGGFNTRKTRGDGMGNFTVLSDPNTSLYESFKQAAEGRSQLV